MFASKDTLLTRPSGYQIQRSLRFRSSATAYLNRTPGTAGNLQKFTWSGWVKRGKLASYTPIFCSNGGNTTDSNFFMVQWLNTDTIAISGALTDWRITTQVFRDPSAWYHIVFAVDTTLATAANRILLYINGVQVTAFGTNSNPAQNLNTAVNNTNAHYISTFNGSGNPSDMYLAEVNFIDGQALTPSSFGAINAVTGVWSATKYAGTYGTNGFYLNFTDNSAATAATIGKDYSGNGNNWTPNNISVTAGATYDSMLDAPLGAGGGERGNYAVLNPLLSSKGTTENANLQVTTTVGVGHSRPTMAIPASGKWYCEFTAVSAATSSDYIFGIVGIDTPEASYGYNQTPSYSYSAFGEKIVNGSFTASFYSTFTNGDIIGCAVNLDGNEINWYKNGTLAGSATSIANGSYFWMISDASGSRQTTTAFNAGQRPFSYTPPTGFKALHTGNLAAPVIALPAQNMAATTYTGTGASLAVSNAVNGVSFQPDLVWIKARGNTYSHNIEDSVRGVTLRLQSDSTAAEAVGANGQVTAFSSGGFTQNGGVETGGSSATYVAWQWKAGGTAVTNTAGSITSSVSANVSAGFSVVTWATNATSGNATIGHGLGVAPTMIFMKDRSFTYSWDVYQANVCTGGNYRLILNTTAALDTGNNPFGGVVPTSSVFTMNQTFYARSGDNIVAYCFTPVAGYSAFGSYTGNGSADGPFVFTGFRPRFVMIKRTDGANSWTMFDSSRIGYNQNNYYVYAQSSNAEATDLPIDILSNGFKIRNTFNDTNASGGTYIYMAFAETPFRNSLAR